MHSCIGIGVSISLIYRLTDAHGIDLLSFVVCLLRTMKEYRDVVVKLFARGKRPGDIFRRLKFRGVKRTVRDPGDRVRRGHHQPSR